MWFAQQSITPVLESTDSTVVITSGDTASAGLFAGMMLVYMFVVFAVWLVSVIAMWKIFVKAGVEGWKAIIPVYNYWVLCEIVGRPGWWGLAPLLMVIPIVNFVAWIAAVVVFIIVSLDLGKAFGKDAVWSVFLLIIFSLIGLLILGFGDAKYTKPAVAVSGASNPPTDQ